MQELSIKINIADRHYPLKIQADDEENVRRAARKVNERLREYVENFAVADKQDALAMIALEFAAEFMGETDKGINVSPDAEMLLTRIEEVLEKAVRS